MHQQGVTEIPLAMRVREVWEAVLEVREEEGHLRFFEGISLSFSRDTHPMKKVLMIPQVEESLADGY